MAGSGSRLNSGRNGSRNIRLEKDEFLTLCVASHPHGYPDHQRLAFLAVLCRLSLDRSLQKQPLLELQQLLLVLLEGIREWQEKDGGELHEQDLCMISHYGDLPVPTFIKPASAMKLAGETVAGREWARGEAPYLIRRYTKDPHLLLEACCYGAISTSFRSFPLKEADMTALKGSRGNEAVWLRDGRELRMLEQVLGGFQRAKTLSKASELIFLFRYPVHVL
ncbi:UNVERIFIED_CONTAM: hypothetical protein K2H54_036632 [Gekko kuhli]